MVMCNQTDRDTEGSKRVRRQPKKADSLFLSARVSALLYPIPHIQTAIPPQIKGIKSFGFKFFLLKVKTSYLPSCAVNPAVSIAAIGLNRSIHLVNYLLLIL